MSILGERYDEWVAAEPPYWPDVPGAETDRPVEVNRAINFGRACVRGAGITTEVIADRFRAGETIPHIAEDYGMSSALVRDAVRYERLCEAQRRRRR